MIASQFLVIFAKNQEFKGSKRLYNTRSNEAKELENFMPSHLCWTLAAGPSSALLPNKR
jgi:hypothetical protein